MGAHLEMVPSFVGAPELEADRAFRSTMFEILARVTELAGLEDTAMVAGADVYTACLAFYSNVKEAAKRGVPGAVTILDDLKRFFPRDRPSSPPAPKP